MKLLKRRIACYLCAAIAFTTVFCQTAVIEAKAATQNVNLRFVYYEQGALDDAKVCVEKGAPYINIGDYCSASVSGYDKNEKYYYNDYSYLSNTTGVKYKSSNSKVLTVNAKTGEAVAKKTGKADVTISFKGKKVKLEFNVVKSLASYKKNYNKINSTVKAAAKNVIKIYAKGINASNKYTLATAMGVYSNRKSQFSNYPSAYTTITEYKDGVTKVNKVVIFNPIIRRSETISSALSEFARERNPLSTFKSKDMFKVVSVNGKGNEINIKLKKGVTENNIFGIQMYERDNTKVAKLNSTSFDISVREDKTGLIYKAKATVTLNSNVIKVNTGSFKMKSGSRYTLVSYSGDWLHDSNVTFRAK